VTTTLSEFGASTNQISLKGRTSLKMAHAVMVCTSAMEIENEDKNNATRIVVVSRDFIFN
jgi:hypothetical protein